jgi:hypothetical protein
VLLQIISFAGHNGPMPHVLFFYLKAIIGWLHRQSIGLSSISNAYGSGSKPTHLQGNQLTPLWLYLEGLWRQRERQMEIASTMTS